MANVEQSTVNGGGANAEDIREFIRKHEARSHNKDFLSPGISQPTLELDEEEVSSQRESDVESRVVDYGFQAWARSSIQSKPIHDSRDFGGLEDSTIQTPRPSAADLARDLDQPIAEDSNLAHVLELAMASALPNDAQTFLPLGNLEAICREEAVRREFLAIYGKESPDVDRYTNYVCGIHDGTRHNEDTSLKIFAILVLIDRLNKINDFVHAEIKDRHLPFRKPSREARGGTFTLVKRTTLNRSEPEPTSCFNGWNPVEKRKFYDNQWRLLSPYFDRALDGTVGLYQLDEQSIMPWIGIGEEKRGTFVPTELHGGYAKVTQVTIHPDHHAFEAKKFAIKELFEDDAIPFANEFRNLKKVQTRDHLLPVYAAYRRGLHYSFVFPWADGGSLIDLWTREPQSLKMSVLVDAQKDTDAYRTRMVITWVASQLAGLTGGLGLGFLHDNKFLGSPQPTLAVPESEKRYGIHGDIKPHNILYFEQDRNKDNTGLGVFKMSDFGLTGFHSAITRSRQPPTGPHSPTYRAPEYGISDAYLSRKYDIWGLGCVILQFLTWLISGPEALKDFDQARLDEVDGTSTNFKEDKFFKNIQAEGDTGPRASKSSVQTHISKLQGIVKQGNYLYDCLELVKTRMLQIKVEERADCREVHNSLEKYYERCLQDVEYVAVTLPTFHESEIPRAHLSVPAIRVTNHSRNPQSNAYNMVSFDRVSNMSADPTASRASTNEAPITKDEGMMTEGEEVAIQHEELGAQPENIETREEHRRSKVQRMFRSLGVCYQIPWRRRGPNV
ncbi:kinase-like domain-containing protein [Xylariaceae sp. AK1471]|nr:kinase-like domain-containing protein [Xylariaceae sp. AK1471]